MLDGSISCPNKTNNMTHDERDKQCVVVVVGCDGGRSHLKVFQRPSRQCHYWLSFDEPSPFHENWTRLTLVSNKHITYHIIRSDDTPTLGSNYSSPKPYHDRHRNNKQSTPTLSQTSLFPRAHPFPYFFPPIVCSLIVIHFYTSNTKE